MRCRAVRGWLQPPDRAPGSSRAGKRLTRFAPSPTGRLHLGHVGHMLYVWGVAGILDGAVLVRIEDHDRQRSKPQYERGLLEDLEWLGFEGASPVARVPSVLRQSDCDRVYASALRFLASRNRVYRCVCTRKSLAQFGSPSSSGEIRYPGICRKARHPESVDHGLRLEWPEHAAPEVFSDGLLGPQCQRPELQCGDLLVRDRLMQWTYQFAVTVDDTRQGVDFVVRGQDLLASTGRQVRLARMLGREEPPAYFHHPLVRDAAGVKLSKKQRAPSVRRLRESGAGRQRVLGEAARAIGLISRAADLDPRDAADLVANRHRSLLSTQLGGDPERGFPHRQGAEGAPRGGSRNPAP